jgi:hypothetical protein
MKLSFYTPIAYDYKYSFATILSYYDIADEIFLAIDEDRISWSGNKYEFDEGFFDKIKELDKDNKIKILQSNFHTLQKPLDNDFSERKYIASFCKKDNYVISIDSDEVILNVKEFFDWINSSKPVSNISCVMKSVFKVFGENVLVNVPDETCQIGTCDLVNNSTVRFGKRPSLLSPMKILHYTLGRTREEVVQKFENWGHSKDFNTKEYIKIWDSVTLENYKEKKELHPILRCKKYSWLSLQLVNIKDFN